MKLEEALLQLDSLYGDEGAERYACRITKATGSYVVYRIVTYGRGNPQWYQVTSYGKLDIFKLLTMLLKAEGYSLETLQASESLDYGTDSWFVTTLSELRDINNLLWTRSEPEYDTVSST